MSIYIYISSDDDEWKKKKIANDFCLIPFLSQKILQATYFILTLSIYTDYLPTLPTYLTLPYIHIYLPTYLFTYLTYTSPYNTYLPTYLTYTSTYTHLPIPHVVSTNNRIG